MARFLAASQRGGSTLFSRSVCPLRDHCTSRAEGRRDIPDHRRLSGRSCRSRIWRRGDRSAPTHGRHGGLHGTCSGWRPGHRANRNPWRYRRSAISSHRRARDGGVDGRRTMLPKAALTPPWAATVWERVGKSLEMTAVLKPYERMGGGEKESTFSERPIAARRPAPPAPRTTQSYSWSTREGEIRGESRGERTKRKRFAAIERTYIPIG